MALRDVMGQDRAVGIILGTLRNNRVPSAYFSRRVGIGKKFIAFNLAKAVNCLQSAIGAQPLFITREPAENHLKGSGFRGETNRRLRRMQFCRKIDSFTHPDSWWSLRKRERSVWTR